MKVLMICRLFHSHIGGVEKHVMEVSTRLQLRGHYVKVLTTKHEKNLPSYETINGIEIYRVEDGNKWKIWSEVFKLFHILNWANVIHVHDIFFWVLPYKLMNPFKKIYTTFHGWEETYPIPFKNIVLRKIWEILSHRNICVGSFISKWYGTKPNFVTYGAV